MRFFKRMNWMLKLTAFILLAVNLTACEQVQSFKQKFKRIFFNTPPVTAPIIPMVKGVKTIKNFAYGTHAQHRLDIYAPEYASHAPIIVMLHGGGWTTGEKEAALIYINKVNRWVPKGFIVISVETRLMPEADVYAQVKDFTQAVVAIQKNAHLWGGNADALILMGHSSGGTIASVLSANPSLVTETGGKRWLATFLLDSSSLDIQRTMRLWKPDMFTYAYGNDAKKWSSASAYDLLSKNSIPMFIACSTFRPDSSCEQAQLFKEKAEIFNIKIEISPQKLNHGEVNDALGVESDYTQAAEVFMASLDANIAQLLTK